VTTTAIGHAKINLSLDIGAVGARGLHDVRTILQPLELGVRVTVSKGDRAEVWWDGRQHDGAAAAAHSALLQLCRYARRSPATLAIAARVIDQFEIAGGIGASSAVVGPLLRATCAFLGLSYDLTTLERLAGEVASDAAFGVRGRTCLAEGYGDSLTPLPAMPPTGVVLVEPSLRYLGADKTRKAYRLRDQSPAPSAAATDRILDVFDQRDWRRLAPLLANDFEPLLFTRFPALAEAAELLRRNGCFVAHLAGSGPCVYGLCDLGDEEVIAAAINHRGLRAVATRTVSA